MTLVITMLPSAFAIMVERGQFRAKRSRPRREVITKESSGNGFHLKTASYTNEQREWAFRQLGLSGSGFCHE